MTDEEIKQRIQYLVEHGGLYDDPIARLHRHAMINRALVLAALALVVVDLALDLLRL
jgi:hypothetical protein